MKKVYKVSKIILLILTVLVGCLILMLLGASFFSLIYNPKTDEELFFETLNNKTNIDFKKCALVSEKNTHGGFMGDGTTYKIYNCYQQDISTKKLKSNLNSLPLSENISKEMSSKRMDYNGESYSYEKIIKAITNGYYLFIDNYSEYYNDIEDIYSDEMLLKRPATNYTLGIYDADTKFFYYFEVDT